MTLKSLKPIKSIKLTLVALSLSSIVSACASHGPTDNPIERRAQWFSYLQGDDIRAACTMGGSAQYRLVYNGIYNEQVRSYDLSADGQLDVRVVEKLNVSALQVTQPSDLLNPWRAKISQTQLPRKAVDELVTALERDGAFGAPAVGTELSSRGFFWTIAACHEGAYTFTGLAWPSSAWDEASFDDVLFALDPSPIVVNPPRKTVTTRSTIREKKGKNEVEFHTKVGTDGLAGSLTFLQ